jgi:rubrerythrin
MVTLVGTQSNFTDALKELLELEYVAVETYTAAINRLNGEEYRNQLSKFKSDHERHIKEISGLLEEEGEKVKQGPGGKQLLTIGSVSISSLFGDKSILSAMSGVEDDTIAAYEKMNQHPEKYANADTIMKQGLEDERRHKKWIQSAVDAHSD